MISFILSAHKDIKNDNLIEIPIKILAIRYPIPASTFFIYVIFYIYM